MTSDTLVIPYLVRFCVCYPASCLTRVPFEPFSLTPLSPPSPPPLPCPPPSANPPSHPLPSPPQRVHAFLVRLRPLGGLFMGMVGTKVNTSRIHIQFPSALLPLHPPPAARFPSMLTWASPIIGTHEIHVDPRRGLVLLKRVPRR